MRAWYESLAERERLFVNVGGVAVVVLVLLGVVLPLNRNVAQARQHVTTKQADLAFINSVAQQVAASGALMRKESVPSRKVKPSILAVGAALRAAAIADNAGNSDPLLPLPISASRFSTRRRAFVAFCCPGIATRKASWMLASSAVSCLRRLDSSK